MKTEVDTADLKRVRRNFEKAARDARAIIAAKFTPGVTMIAPEIEAVYRRPGMTPVKTGALRASTRATVAITGLDAIVTVEQPATNKQGDQYVQWVINPHKTRGTTMTTGNDYPSRANEIIMPIVDAMLARTGRDAVREIQHVMKGAGGTL